MVLHHIGRTAPGVRNCIVDPVTGLHVLPHIVYAHIHQFHCVQSASAQVRRSRRMGGNAVKPEISLAVCLQRASQDSISPGRMPGKGCIQAIEHACPGQISFS